MSLVIDAVRKTFPGKHGAQEVLRGVDLEVQRGEFVSIIGHSGCGKSTLLSVVAGLTSATSGRVTVDGKLVTGPGPDRAVVFQNYSLLPWMSVYANVKEAVMSARPDRTKAENLEQIERYLRVTNLWPHRSKRPGQISGGMRQRAAVARAFAVGPQVLLLDEPFGALDALTRAQLQEQLVELWSGEDGGVETVVMVTHGIDEAIFLADRIVVMANPPLASIAEVIDVPLARPRDKATLPTDPGFLGVHERLTHLLQHELVVPDEVAAA
jgi:nitrate ABC transporter ATP-binding subunit